LQNLTARLQFTQLKAASGAVHMVYAGFEDGGFSGLQHQSANAHTGGAFYYYFMVRAFLRHTTTRRRLFLRSSKRLGRWAVTLHHHHHPRARPTDLPCPTQGRRGHAVPRTQRLAAVPRVLDCARGARRRRPRTRVARRGAVV
jgi:hypothetical protein